MTANIIKRKNGNANVQSPNLMGWVDQLFQDNLNRFFNDDTWGFTGLEHRTNVPVNVRETDKSYEMELIAPGLRKEDFKLNVQGDLLTVSFEHSSENKQEEENWVRQEYKKQSFTRSFNLDDTIDANKIMAKYTDGVLYLTLPKKENAQRMSRTIQVG